jgi:hypothetical protein
MESHSGMTLADENRRTLRKTCLTVTCTTNYTWNPSWALSGEPEGGLGHEELMNSASAEEDGNETVETVLL